MKNNALNQQNLATLTINQAQQWVCQGAWTQSGVVLLQKQIATLPTPTVANVTIDTEGISAMDTVGAWLLLTVLKQFHQHDIKVELLHFKKENRALLELLQKQNIAEETPVLKQENVLAVIGIKAIKGFNELTQFLNFIGELFIHALTWIRHPKRIRLIPFLSGILFTGYSAMMIVALLAFLIGVVLAYQLGIQLQSYGANIYVVDLLGIALLREFAPLLTAIIIAGRTGSSYTAQIGTMKLNEEIDALQTFGLSPVELLVLPRMFALIVALPLLTVLADVFSVLGGMLMSNGMLGISFGDFISRFGKVVALKNYVIGLVKTPVFAVLIASIGCFQGFQVTGSARSVGEHTTTSVVQAIFMIIVADAAFSIIFSKLGI